MAGTRGRKCGCGCGREIVFKPHHKKHGIPKFIHGHHRRMSDTEIIEFNGILFNRRPGKRYFWGKGGALSLHRAIWAFHNGNIPPGHDVHHKNGDWNDNSVENLECLTPREHASRHPGRGTFPGQREHLIRIREMAAEWHHSEEGRAWHREHAKRVGNNRISRTIKCSQCGKGFESKCYEKGNRFCSRRCSNEWKIDRLPAKNCELCGKEFHPRGTEVRFCNKSCSGTYNSRNRKNSRLRPGSRRSP